MAMPPPPPPMSHAMLEEGGRPGSQPDEPVSRFVVCMNVINTVTHLLLGGIAMSAFICVNYMKIVTLEIIRIEITKISAHVYFSVIGYVILFSQAVLSLNPRTGWGDNFKYPQKTKIYWSLQVLGSFLAIIGSILAIVAVSELSDLNIPSIPGIPLPASDHLDSGHQIVGLVAMILTTVSLVGGVVNLICPTKMNKILKTLYTYAMTLTLVIAFIAICLAFDELRALLIDTSANMAISFTVLAVVAMLMMLIGDLTVAGGKGIL